MDQEADLWWILGCLSRAPPSGLTHPSVSCWVYQFMAVSLTGNCPLLVGTFSCNITLLLDKSLWPRICVLSRSASLSQFGRFPAPELS